MANDKCSLDGREKVLNDAGKNWHQLMVGGEIEKNYHKIDSGAKKWDILKWD